MKLVSVDIETTGLDPSLHEAWEIAIVPICQDREDPDEVAETGPPLLYQLPVNLLHAEQPALEISRYHERAMGVQPGRALRWTGPNGDQRQTEIPIAAAAIEMASVLKGACLVGMSVHFDAGFIAEFFRKTTVASRPPWHHRHLDLGSYAAGAVGAGKALAGLSLADRIPNENVHSALADAEWNVEVYEAIRDGRFS